MRKASATLSIPDWAKLIEMIVAWPDIDERLAMLKAINKSLTVIEYEAPAEEWTARCLGCCTVCGFCGPACRCA